MAAVNAVSTKSLFHNLNLPYPPVTPTTLPRTVTPPAAGTVTPAGGRNTMLTSLGGALRHRGLQRQAIERMLQIANTELCWPPLSVAEVARVAISVSNYPAASTPSGIRKSLNDVGNAARLVTTFVDDIRYLAEAKRWLVWNNGRWSTDQHSIQITGMATLVAINLFNDVPIYAAQDPDVAKDIARHAKSSHSLPRLEAMISLATRDPLVTLHARCLNYDKMLLGVDNGVLDLRAGKLRPGRRNDLITHFAPVTYDPKAKCPTFWRFLNRITAAFDVLPRRQRRAAQRSFIAYLQRLVGYCLTGRTDEQVVFFFYGLGANGKSTLLGVLQDLLGHDLAKQTQPETLMDVPNTGTKASNDIARLVGARLVTSNETEDGKFLSESLIKQLTGGDPITCRFLYQEHFEYHPEFKLVISGNHRPVVRGTDDGIWRRIHLVPFVVTIPPGERDPNLGQKLRAELPGILNWALKGCREWQQDGLRPPHLVRAAVTEYREDSDLLGQWISEELVIDAQSVVAAAELYLNYSYWAERNNVRPLSSVALGRRLKERGFTKGRTSRGIEYHGLRVYSPAPVLRLVPSPNFGTPEVAQASPSVAVAREM